MVFIKKEGESITYFFNETFKNINILYLKLAKNNFKKNNKIILKSLLRSILLYSIIYIINISFIFFEYFFPNNNKYNNYVL